MGKTVLNSRNKQKELALYWSILEGNSIMKDLNKWFGVPESELKKITKDNYYNVKLKHNIELTLDNVKEFFYDFECNPNHMEGRLNDFLKLKIPNETIISWTTDYYKEDIKRYDSLSTKEKLYYLSDITGILDQFTEPFSSI